MLAAVTNRARLLFFLLAGVSVSLLAARGRAGTSVLLRRAAFLTALGVLLALSGWDDVVLVFYGVLFVLAPLLLRLATPALLAVAVVSALPAVLLLAQDLVSGQTPTPWWRTGPRRVTRARRRRRPAGRRRPRPGRG